jgi:two-component system chemotaxis family response regulator WspR
MIEARKAESRAHLRHDCLTPVNHIMGYSQLLIEEAGERHIEPFVPVFHRIHEGGRELLESIRIAFSEPAGPANGWEGQAFQANLHAALLEMSSTLTSLTEAPECCRGETPADLNAISLALCRLSRLAGAEPRGDRDRGVRGSGTLMIEALHVESRAHLRHEYRTPVNHIMGYSELLIEEAGERRLEPFIPVFQRIHEGGRELLESIRSVFGEHAADADGTAFKTNIRAAVLEISRPLTALAEDLECSHRETLADLGAISGAVARLLELTGLVESACQAGEMAGAGGNAKRIRLVRRAGDLSGDVAAIPVKRNGGKILIADDDDANRTLLRRRLESDGHEIVEAKNGLEVLESLKDSPCDLVLLDILMPALDGFQTLARMKQDNGLRELPVIMISALDEVRNVVRCIEMGAEDYLTKPFDRVLLRARIGASLEKKWLRDRERLKTDELEQTLRLLEQAQEQLTQQASRDALTGLANRRSVETHLDFRMKHGTPFTAIYIDLNGFKKINDTYGHAAGDDLLKQVADRLRRAFRSSDVIGRWGGDEFVALVSTNSVDGQTGIPRIAECLADDFVISKNGAQHRVTIGAAVGVTAWKQGDTATELLRRADFAMYEEKLARAR